MISFFRNNSYYIMRLFATQVGISVFAMMLAFATAATNDTIFLLVSVASVVFYCILIYSTCWEMGYKNQQKVDAGRLTVSEFHGLYVALCANALNILLVVLFWIGYAFSGSSFGSGLFYVVDKILFILLAMYRGIVRVVAEKASDVPLVTCLLYTAALLPGMISALIANIRGSKGKSLFNKTPASLE